MSLIVWAQKGDGGAETHCDPSYVTDIGPMMTQPDGTLQSIPFDCTATSGCDMYFDATMSAGQTLFLSTCGSSFDTGLSAWSGAGYTTQEDCNDDSCSLQSELTFVAPGNGTFRIRIGGFGGASGPGTLAYQGDVGITIVGATGGGAQVPTLNQYALYTFLVLLAGAAVFVARKRHA